MISSNINCTGCSACYSICPQQAISMISDNEGFLVPKINTKKCSECGKCDAVCPLNHQNTEKMPIAVYAAKHSNEETRLFSSSGGMFSAFAEKMIAENGVVFGAKFDENMEVIHSFTETIEGLADFRGSKYVQSNIGNSYIDAKRFLDSGRQVLFTGTPCQIAGLKSFLQKDYKNLLTIDLICYGVPSPLIWKRYLESILEKYKDSVPDLKITRAFFRGKKESWEKYNFSLYASSEYLNREFEIAYDLPRNNKFLQCFFNRTAHRNSCFSCQFKSLKSESDITVGDFWGIKDVLPDFYDQNGVSAVLVNSEKGKFFFEQISDIKSIITTYDSAIKNNTMIEHSASEPIERKVFFDKINKKNEFKSIKYENPISHKIGILTNVIGDNYGGVLQAYALMEELNLLNQKPIFIRRTYQPIKKQKIPVKIQIRALLRQIVKKYLFMHGDSWAYLSFKRMSINSKLNSKLNFYNKKIMLRYFNSFIKENIYPQTKFCVSTHNLKAQTKDLDIIVVGSDQVWRPEYTPTPYKDIYDNFCDFLGDSDIKRFSYAASFGTDDWRYTIEEATKCRDLLKKFIAVSVRESNGVQMCTKYFNRQATHVLDPTMLLTKDFYEQKFVKNIKNSTGAFIFNYILDQSYEKTEILEHLSKTLNKKYESIIWSEFMKTKQSLPSIETWLTNYSNSDFVFTDSFHGTVFSIIFNKPFIVFMNKDRGNARFTSLLETFNLTDRLIISATELTEEKITAPIDWKKVNTILELEREKSLNFLTNTLAEIEPINHVKRPRYSLKRFVGKVLKRIIRGNNNA